MKTEIRTKMKINGEMRTMRNVTGNVYEVETRSDEEIEIAKMRRTSIIWLCVDIGILAGCLVAIVASLLRANYSLMPAVGVLSPIILIATRLQVIAIGRCNRRIEQIRQDAGKK